MRRRPGACAPPWPGCSASAGTASPGGAALLQATHGDARCSHRVRDRPRQPERSRGGGGVAMRAVCWYGARDIRMEDVPSPTVLNPRDAIAKVTAAAICGSDLHLYNGIIPTIRKGDVLGHEFMGEVVEVGLGNKALRPGERVIIISHRWRMSRAAEAYRMWNDKTDGRTKFVLDPTR